MAFFLYSLALIFYNGLKSLAISVEADRQSVSAISGNGSNPLTSDKKNVTRPLMQQYIKILCRYCGKDDLVKNGHSENGTQRYRCNHCKKSFQADYSYNAWQPGIKEQIETQLPSSRGIRDISRSLGISKNTVISELKKIRRK